jgi:hypothetical protein
MLIEIPPVESNKLGSALTPDEYRALDVMRATGGITPEQAQKLGIIDIAVTVKKLRALGYAVRELTNDPRIEPREYAFTVYTLYDEVRHIQAFINRLSGLCINDSLIGRVVNKG